MKLHAKTITITLTPELSNAIFNYLQTQDTSETKSMQKLLNYGIEIENGHYHDQQLGIIQEQLKALNRNHQTINARLKNIEGGLADIDDDILQQESDLDPLIDVNKLKQDRNQN